MLPAPLTVSQSEVRFNGHAIECRINAENPKTFRPSPGKITHFHTPGGLGVRVDSGAYAGYTIPPFYDSLIGKLIVHARNRTECLMRLKRALNEFVVDGIETTTPLFMSMVGEADIANGGSDRFIDAMCLWGDADTVRRGLRAHFDAGATHVCLQPVHEEGNMAARDKIIETLADV